MLLSARNFGGDGPLPEPEADWQPGVIKSNEKLRPTLDGEPVAGAIAASIVRGWVLIAGGVAEIKRRHRVEVMPGGHLRIYGSSWSNVPEFAARLHRGRCRRASHRTTQIEGMSHAK